MPGRFSIVTTERGRARRRSRYRLVVVTARPQAIRSASSSAAIASFDRIAVLAP